MKKRLTIKILTNLLNEMFKREGLKCYVDTVKRTRYRGHEYEAGAATFNVWVKYPGEARRDLYLLFDWLQGLEREWNDGKVPTLEIARYGFGGDGIVFKKIEKKNSKMKMTEINGEQWFTLVAPDGTFQAGTLSPDYATTIAMIGMMARSGQGKPLDQLWQSGFKILPVKLTLVQNGSEEDAFRMAKELKQQI